MASPALRGLTPQSASLPQPIADCCRAAKKCAGIPAPYTAAFLLNNLMQALHECVRLTDSRGRSAAFPPPRLSAVYYGPAELVSHLNAGQYLQTYLPLCRLPLPEAGMPEPALTAANPGETGAEALFLTIPSYELRWPDPMPEEALWELKDLFRGLNEGSKKKFTLTLPYALPDGAVPAACHLAAAMHACLCPDLTCRAIGPATVRFACDLAALWRRQTRENISFASRCLDTLRVL